MAARGFLFPCIPCVGENLSKRGKFQQFSKINIFYHRFPVLAIRRGSFAGLFLPSPVGEETKRLLAGKKQPGNPVLPPFDRPLRSSKTASFNKENECWRGGERVVFTKKVDSYQAAVTFFLKWGSGPLSKAPVSYTGRRAPWRWSWAEMCTIRMSVASPPASAAATCLRAKIISL